MAGRGSRVFGPDVDVIRDGGFEAGSPNPFWAEFSTNFGTPLCTLDFCNPVGSGPHSGSWWAWFGGIDAYEEGSVSQEVTIPEGTAMLSFWVEIATVSGTGQDYLQVQIDDEVIWEATDEDQATYPVYTLIELDVSEYADGGSHVVEFYSEVFGTGISNFFVDDVMLDAQAGGGGEACEEPTTDIPWLSVNPTNGSTGPGEVSVVEVTFNSTGLFPGTYTGSLCIRSTDPDEPVVIVPVTLVVEAIADIAVEPVSLESVQQPDTQTTQMLDISNVGTVRCRGTSLR